MPREIAQCPSVSLCTGADLMNTSPSELFSFIFGAVLGAPCARTLFCISDHSDAQGPAVRPSSTREEHRSSLGEEIAATMRRMQEHGANLERLVEQEVADRSRESLEIRAIMDSVWQQARWGDVGRCCVSLLVEAAQFGPTLRWHIAFLMSMGGGALRCCPLPAARHAPPWGLRRLRIRMGVAVSSGGLGKAMASPNLRQGT